jgi:FixJ family two-component response regulator
MSPPLVAIGDDYASVRRTLRCLLRSASLRVHTYASAAELLDTGIGGAPESGILDRHLRGMTRWERISRLRESGHGPQTAWTQ